MAAPSTTDTRVPRLVLLWVQMRERRQHKPGSAEHEALLGLWLPVHTAVPALKEELEGG